MALSLPYCQKCGDYHGGDDCPWVNWEVGGLTFVNDPTTIDITGHYHLTLTDEQVFAKHWS